jgi:hypothetical protein
MISDVQGWVDGGLNNFGWILVGDSTTFPTAKRFNTRENTSGSPTLSVEFTVIPEPSAALLPLVLLAMLAQRQNDKRRN